MGAQVTDSLLPHNATENERTLEAAAARVSDVPVPVRDVWRPDSCPAPLLPWLASQDSVDQWDTNWTEGQKRQTIRDSVFVHRHKGTIGAVRRALAALGFGVRVQEWFNQIPAGVPYTYRLLLEADQVGIDQAALAKIYEVIDGTKNLRSHLDVVVPSVTSQAGPTVAAAASLGTEITVSNWVGNLVADGSVIADGTFKANGIKLP